MVSESVLCGAELCVLGPTWRALKHRRRPELIAAVEAQEPVQEDGPLVSIMAQMGGPESSKAGPISVHVLSHQILAQVSGPQNIFKGYGPLDPCHDKKMVAQINGPQSYLNECGPLTSMT